MIRRGQSDWIKSKACPWPKTVREQALLVLEKNEQLARMKQIVRRQPMMTTRKVEAMRDVVEAMNELSNAYSNLMKEIAFYLGVDPNHLTQGNLP